MYRFIILVTLGLVTASSTAYGQIVYDLGQGWSDTSNPIGVWTYRQGTTPLPHVANWRPSQPAWAPGAEGSPPFLPVLFKATGNDSPTTQDWQTGDVVGHSQDDTNGAGMGPLNVVWTSPGQGTISIAGGVWEAREIGRSNHWSLLFDGAALTGGDIASGDSYHSSNPFLFSAGSGGPGSVTGLPVLAGDTVELLLVRNGLSGDFIGIEDAVTFTPVPEPSTLLLAGVGGMAAVMRTRRARRRDGFPG